MNIARTPDTIVSMNDEYNRNDFCRASDYWDLEPIRFTERSLRAGNIYSAMVLLLEGSEEAIQLTARLNSIAKRSGKTALSIDLLDLDFNIEMAADIECENGYLVNIQDVVCVVIPEIGEVMNTESGYLLPYDDVTTSFNNFIKQPKDSFNDQ